jgi:hypothetical protein
MAKKSKSPKRKIAKTRKGQKPKTRKRENAKTQKRVSRLGKARKAKPVAKKPKPVAKKPRPAFKKRSSKSKVKKAPRGFVDVVKKQSPEIAHREINERLEKVKEALAAIDVDSRVRVHSYVDESIDGEILVQVPRGTSTNDLVLDMEEAMGRSSMPGFWINMGVRFTIKRDEEIYRRLRGMNDVNTHYQAGVPANWSEIPLIVRKVIVKGMEKKYGRKTESVYLRIHWSPDGKKPKSRG